MNMQFGFGGFNPYTGMSGSGFNQFSDMYSGMGGMGGFNPYMGMHGGMGGFNPYMGMYGGMGGFNPYMGMYGGFPMLNPMQFFQDYIKQLPVQQDGGGTAAKETPTKETAVQETPSTETTTPVAPAPYQFGAKFGINALTKGQFTQGGVRQLKEAGIVQNRQQANQMLKDFQGANAGQDVTQQQFQDYASSYKAPTLPTLTYKMPAAKTVQNNRSNIKT